MIAKDINNIVLTDFEALIENEIPEGRSIEYKQALSIANDTEKKEFLADVSSFANSGGGDIIYGVAENGTTGIPEKLAGLTFPNLDVTLRQMDNLIRDGITPRINGIVTKTFDLADKTIIIFIRIPKSWNSPHQVILKGSSRFFGRASNGKYPLDIDELRAAFLLTDNTANRIRNFIADRIAMIGAAETPVPLFPNGKIALHVIPVSSFQTSKSYDIQNPASPIRKIRPLSGGSRTPRFNLEGLITSSMTGLVKDHYDNYAQVFRNGIIETVSAEILFGHMDEKFIRGSGDINYEKLIVETINEYLDTYHELSIDLPAFIFLSFIDVAGYKLTADNVRSPLHNPSIQKNIFTLPEVMVSSHEEDIPELLKPLFDTVWNACGYTRSYNYDETGKWQPIK
jgi:hypothetical protein